MRRARVFWIALPIAIVFALWAGPGLAVDEDEMSIEDETRASEPAPTESVAPVEPKPVEPKPVDEPECEAPHDPGPDGDR